MIISFRFEAKQSEKTFISFRLKAKQKNQKRNETKRKIFGSETKQKYGVFISLWLKAKNSKRKKAKWSEKKIIFFRVSVRNACETDLVSLRFAWKRKTFWSETGAPYVWVCVGRLVGAGLCASTQTPDPFFLPQWNACPCIKAAGIFWLSNNELREVGHEHLLKCSKPTQVYYYILTLSQWICFIT